MRFIHDDRTYELVCVTGVASYSLEMTECHPENRETFVMSANRTYSSQTVEVSMHVDRLDYEVAKLFLDAVKINLLDLIEPPDLEDTDYP